MILQWHNCYFGWRPCRIANVFTLTALWSLIKTKTFVAINADNIFTIMIFLFRWTNIVLFIFTQSVVEISLQKPLNNVNTCHPSRGSRGSRAILHHEDINRITVMWSKSPATQMFVQGLVQTNDTENVKAPLYFVGGDRSLITGGFRLQRTSNAEWIALPGRHHSLMKTSAEINEIFKLERFVFRCWQGKCSNIGMIIFRKHFWWIGASFTDKDIC